MYFLLGYEKNTWSGFIGGNDDIDKSILDTAIREFNEETAGIFLEYLDVIKEKLNKSILIKTKSPSNKNVYIFFLELNSNLLNYDISQIFLKSKKKQTDKHFKEKKNIKWFSYTDIKNKKIIVFNNLYHEIIKLMN